MTRILTALVATVFIAFAAPVAEAAPKTTFTIRGAGWGHGVGMSQYGAMGYAQQRLERRPDPRPLLLRHRARDDRPEQARARPARLGDALGADQRRPPGRLAQARSDRDLHAQAARAVADRPVARAASGSRRSRAPLQVAGDGGVTTLGGHGSYRGVLEFAPTVFTGIAVTNVVALDDYLQGVVPGRVAGVVARRGAEGAGDRRPHVRDHDGQERRLRPLRRHALAGLQGRRDRDGVDQRRGRRDARPDRHLPGPAGRDLLLLDLGRAHRVGREHVAGPRAEAVAEVGRGRVRQRLAAPPVDGRS